MTVICIIYIFKIPPLFQLLHLLPLFSFINSPSHFNIDISNLHWLQKLLDIANTFKEVFPKYYRYFPHKFPLLMYHYKHISCFDELWNQSNYSSGIMGRPDFAELGTFLGQHILLVLEQHSYPYS